MIRLLCWGVTAGWMGLVAIVAVLALAMAHA